jgi:hypothetical protein
MEARLLNLKNDFNNLINIRNNVKNIFEILQLRIDKLKLLYSEFIQNNKNQVFVFGLDSFHFQSKLIDIEYDDIKRLFMAIGNRMYCEYFKLNKITIEYILNNIKDKKTIEIIKINNYPIYKDLEPFKEYKFETLMEIHENILKMLTILVSELNNKENELTIHKSKQHIGLNIDNFVTTFNYNNNVMRERIIMFITYIEFFHKLHTKYLKRFSKKIQLIYTDISNDIKFDESLEINNSNSINSSNNRKIMNQSILTDSDNESSKSDKLLSRKNSVKSKSDNSIKNANNNINSNYIFESIINKKNNKLDKNDYNKIDNSATDEEINNLFLTIGSSCDSMINKNKEITEVEAINIPLSREIIDSVESNDKPENIELIVETKEEMPLEENDEISLEEKEEVPLEENEEVPLEENEESNNTTDIEPEPEPETKKKRTYKPRKKKV